MDHTRSYDLLTPHLAQQTRVTLIGTGGIGAATAVALAKMGIGYLDLFDGDTVEEVNIPTQLLRPSDIGKSKVSSVAALLKELTDVSGGMHPHKVTKSTIMPPADIIVSALDSIEARKLVWSKVLHARTDWYLDARMGAQTFMLHTVKMPYTEHYHNMVRLEQENDVPDEPCTAKATIYTAFIAAGHIAHQVRRILMKEPVPSMMVHDIARFALDTPGRMIE